MSWIRASPANEVEICFHGVGPHRPHAPSAEEPYWLPRDTFLRFLDEFVDWPSAQLSFDDGNASDAEIVLPALVERGLSAVFYPLAGRLDQPGSLSKEQIRSLVEAGMGVGSHGWAHVPWAQLAPECYGREMEEARTLLSEASGQQVNQVALPFGSYNRKVLRQLRIQGYSAVASSDQMVFRPGDWLTPRFTIRSHDTPEGLRERIERATTRRHRAQLKLRLAVKRLR